MNGTADIDPIDLTIDQVERLYRSVTGREMSRSGDGLFAIPPEKTPEQHIDEQMDQLLLGLDRLSSRMSGPSWVPRITVWESPSELFVSVDVPGVPRDSVELRLISRGVLEVSGLRPTSVRNGDADRHRELRHAEQVRGRFRRLIPIPPGVSADELNAKLEDGELQIRIPCPEPQSQESRTIQVA